MQYTQQMQYMQDQFGPEHDCHPRDGAAHTRKVGDVDHSSSPEKEQADTISNQKLTLVQHIRAFQQFERRKARKEQGSLQAMMQWDGKGWSCQGRGIGDRATSWAG